MESENVDRAGKGSTINKGDLIVIPRGTPHQTDCDRKDLFNDTDKGFRTATAGQIATDRKRSTTPRFGLKFVINEK